MISIEETKKWLSKNRVDENGDINLNDLDFSDFDGNVNISGMKVKGNLCQDSQEVKGNLYQCSQKVEGSMYLQDTSNLSKCTNPLGFIYYREIPEMTLEELEKIVGYKFKLKEMKYE